jgi:hypothetical protein
VKRLARYAVLCALCLVEPCLHALGIPHPEGLSAQAANLLFTTTSEP